MKNLVLFGVVLILALVLGGFMATENIIFGPMAVLPSEPLEQETAAEPVVYSEDEKARQDAQEAKDNVQRAVVPEYFNGLRTKN